MWFFSFLIGDSNVALFNSKGIIAAQQHSLMVKMVLIMLIIVIPVFIGAILISLKYREGNNSDYTPERVHSPKLQLFFWSLPLIIVVILSVINWKSTHLLDPFKPISSSNKPITIQVVALQWKWLFIYPEQNIATVNLVQFPANTPVVFELTADAPMNSFWIPQLAGQMYAMPGMKTHLNLIADAPGEFNGSAAEINGEGFSGMKFLAKATTQSEFDEWVKMVKNFHTWLGMEEYKKLAGPTVNEPIAYYSASKKDLYNQIMMKFLAPITEHEMTGIDSMDHMMHATTLPPHTN